MKKTFLKHRTNLGLTAILLLVTLILAARYELLPLGNWIEYIVPRTPINVTAVPIGTMNRPLPITGTATFFVIPAIAVFQDNQGLNYIYLADNGKALRQPISMVEAMGDVIAMTAIVPEQALVITSNVSGISNGDPIMIVE